MLTDASPFVLLDDARRAGASDARLYRGVEDVAVAATPADVPAVLATLRTWSAGGAHIAGFLGYEAGHMLDAALRPLAAGTGTDWPCAWFARFGSCERIAADDVPTILPDPAGAMFGPLQPAIDYGAYQGQIEQVLGHIAAGDIYQANLTFAAHIAVHGSPLSAYARLRNRAAAGYGGLVFTGTHWLLSFSPELFVSLRGGQVMTRPMKGTAQRGRTHAEDAGLRADLASDPKQRAENLMIVDLLRNDLSRVCGPGSVTVPHLFRVETYPTVHQMVSDVAGTLDAHKDAVDVLAAMFPCGSITGAPKIRAMQIIDAVEPAPRGPYTGSIGFIGPDGDAAFNVAIRTLALRKGQSCATLGLGSGIVADSQAAAEWQECLLKGEFVRAADPSFDLLETMAFDPMDGVARLEAHIARLGASARELGFAFDRHAARNQLQHATFRLRAPAKLRLRLSRLGNIAIETTPMPPPVQEPVTAVLAHLPVATDDLRLRHKTSDRDFYDDARRAADAFEVIFTAPDGQITEGSFTSVFVERDGRLLTPPQSVGLLPGVLRDELLAQGRAVEAPLTADDLAEGFFIGNAVRGLIRAKLA